MQNEENVETAVPTAAEQEALDKNVADMVEAATATEAIEAPKTPLFIGCADKEQVDKILTVLDTEKYEAAMLAPDILQASTQNWFYTKLSQAERNRLDQERKNEQYRKDALQYANEFHDHFDTAFRGYELKKYLNNDRRWKTNGKKNNVNVSNTDVDNIIALLLNFKFLTITDPTTPRHKQVYALTIDQTSRLEHLQNLRVAYEFEEQAAQQNIKAIDDEIGSISGELLNDAKALENIAPAEEAAPAKRKRTKRAPDATPATPKRKKKVVAGAEQVAPSDAINDNATDVTTGSDNDKPAQI